MRWADYLCGVCFGVLATCLVLFLLERVVA